MSAPAAPDLNRTALDPRSSVVIEACAGSGKTWLLVARILRLLLAGAKPSEILAITFTRKAAQEMAARLREWLELLAIADDDTVRAFLREREVPASELRDILPRSRNLFEDFLTSQPSITLSTFHSWFLQLLRRAPLDAGAPGDVTLIEQTAPLLAEAWQLFARAAQRARDAPATRGLEHLHAQCGVENTRKLLERFVARRADWWAAAGAHEGAQAIEHVLGAIGARMRVAPGEDVCARLAAQPQFRSDLNEYVRLLGRNTDVDKARAARFPEQVTGAEVFSWARETLLTKADDAPRARKPSAAQRTRLGGDAQEVRLLSLHASLGERVREALDDLADQASYRFNEAALHAGVALLDAYQGVKAQRLALDHADVEWRAAQLIAHGEHALYMQFKLDARYRHVLLDEFQDTNPLQWVTLQAWFSAAHEAGLRPTVFVVGDPKQSIYRFRRAEPRLFGAAAQWLGEHFGARRVAHDSSRRCAPAIIALVNRVFAGTADFNLHAAHYTRMPGRCEVLPLIARANGAGSTPPVAGAALRDPLTCPRVEPEDDRREQEAAALARGIAFIVGRWRVSDDPHGDDARAARFSDVMVLVRRRTHLVIYERALRHAGIPFITSRQGGLLDTLEARDLLALLRFLVSPFDDLCLAHALRSPVFGCDDVDLMALARDADGSWWERLQRAADAQSVPCSAALARAHGLLAAMLARADALPVHDQLDRIYFEADVLARYAAAVPSATRAAVAANLQAFMQQALDADSGRYPSLPRFIAELEELARAPAEEAPDEGIVGDASDAVRILTVHGAKGLESPVVWILDAAAAQGSERGHDVMVDWPPHARAPEHFSLWSRQKERSREQRRIADEESERAERENLNLLYVAMTRARQALIVSGIDAGAANGNWYDRVRTAAVACAGAHSDDATRLVAFGDDLGRGSALAADLPGAQPIAHVVPDPALQRPLPAGTRRELASGGGQRYGTLFHAVMERLTESRELSAGVLAAEFGETEEAAALAIAQAQRLVRCTDLTHFFDPTRYIRALNEVAYADESGAIHRIDRLVIGPDAIWVLDYKTGASATVMGTDTERAYREQVARYRHAMQRAYPNTPVRGRILFAGGGYIDIDDLSQPPGAP